MISIIPQKSLKAVFKSHNLMPFWSISMRLISDKKTKKEAPKERKKRKKTTMLQEGMVQQRNRMKSQANKILLS
jgi:hypothetical protein